MRRAIAAFLATASLVVSTPASTQSSAQQTLTAQTVAAQTLTAQTATAQTVAAQTLTAQTVTAQTVTAQTLTAQTVAAQTLTAQTLTAQTAPVQATPMQPGTRDPAHKVGIWKAAVPPKAMQGEFDSMDPLGVAAGARIKADCSLNWIDPDDGALYCFSSGTSLEYFMDHPKASIASAQRGWQKLRARPASDAE